jgi:UDP-2,3-diacylglucosamine pyrophosphatase LpxH
MRTLIISDLHLGNGGPYDSFAGERELPALIDAYAGSRSRIIVNGDGVDFLMNEEPLALDVARAVAQARSIVAHRASRAVLESMGRALGAGSEVVFRLGNHDIELALPEVQEVLRGALAAPPQIARRLSFQLTRDYGLKFANLLKPDFQGAALAALGVAPAAMKVLLQGATAGILWHLFRKMSGPAAFAEGDVVEEWGLADRIAEAGLSEEERAALEEFGGDSAPSFAEEEEGGPFSRARLKVARAGLRLYAGMQRSLAGKEGDSFFALDPTPDEWKEARRLSEKYRAGAVILGHTHAARWGEQGGLVFANTGTWIWLMQLPRSDASDEAWMDFLSELRSNGRLDPSRQRAARTIARFTAVELDEHPSGGARVSLVEWVPDEGVRTLKSTVVQKSA